MMAASAGLTIDDLLRQVPEGQTRLFERPIKDVVEERFFSVHMNWEYNPGRLTWHNKVPFEQAPWAGSRGVPRRPISALPQPEVTFKGPSKQIVDFYAVGGEQAFFISDKLARLIEDLDPGSLNRRSIAINAKDGVVDYNIVMSARLLEAVDPSRTDVLVKYKNYAGQWIRSIEFPDGVVFRGDALVGVHSFTDVDVRGWFWSRELIDAAKAAGTKGLYTQLAGRISIVGVDDL
jgi:hypothetical protein